MIEKTMPQMTQAEIERDIEFVLERIEQRRNTEVSRCFGIIYTQST